jgi:hypothetical protein
VSGAPRAAPARGDRDRGQDEARRALARRRLARIAVAYALAATVTVVVNAVLHGPTWWYFAAAGFGAALGMQALRLRA